MTLSLIAFTKAGGELALRLSAALTLQGEQCTAYGSGRAGELPELQPAGPLAQWAKTAWEASDGLIFVGACGITVRAIAPLVQDKFRDPAVLSLDEKGRFVIPLLSGHVGGANLLAGRVAAICGGVPVLSTATDVNGLFAVDQWAAQNGLLLEGRATAKKISAALLAGETVGVASDFPIQGSLPQGCTPPPAELGFYITHSVRRQPFPETLYLRPRTITLGIGCRRDTPTPAIEAAVLRALDLADVARTCVRMVASVDLKAREPGLLEFCRQWGLPFVTDTPEALAAVPGDFTPSAFVAKTVGVDNVCERAAALRGGKIILKKQALEGVTVAIATADFTPVFSEESI
jgi:cobalt-precorrin 5A hydrolase